MWTILSIAVPLAVIVIFLVRCGRSPLAMCSLVVVITLGPAVYLDTSPISIEVPLLPQPLGWRDVTMLAMVLAWGYAMASFRHRPSRRLVAGIDTWIVLALAGLLLFEMLVTWEADGSVGFGVAYAMRVWLFLLISMAMWVSILRRATSEEVVRFLDTLAWLMVPLSLLYCVSELGLWINPHVGWAPFSAGDTVVLRDTLTFPFFTPLGLAWFCAKKRQSIWLLGAQAVLLAACVLSYSRTIAAGAIMIVVTVTLMRAFGTRSASKVVTSATALGGLVGVAAVALLLFAPGQAGYALERFAPAVESGTRETNAANRLSWFRDGVDIVQEADPVFGLGFGKVGHDTLMSYAQRPTVFLGDFSWALLLFTFGWLGLVLYASMYAQYLLLAMVNAVKRGSASMGLPLALAGVALYDVIRTWARCPWNAYPTASALMLALLYVDRRRVWADAPAHLCVAGGEDREPISRSHQAVRLRPCPRGHHSIEGALTRGLGG